MSYTDLLVCCVCYEKIDFKDVAGRSQRVYRRNKEGRPYHYGCSLGVKEEQHATRN